MIKKCLICQTEFKTWPCSLKRGGGKYCSNQCVGIANRIDPIQRLKNQRNATKKWAKEHRERMLELGRKYYHAHPDRVKRKMLLNKERSIKNLQWIREYKQQHGCKECGEKDIRCLDFHHLHSKHRNISNIHSYSTKTIMKEIDKCEILCANCHRKLTFSHLSI